MAQKELNKLISFLTLYKLNNREASNVIDDLLINIRVNYETQD